MHYKHLPPVGSISLPHLEWHPTAANSTRFGANINRVWIHRWGGTLQRPFHFDGVVAEFENTRNQASSHIVYAGQVGRDARRAVQMVPYSRKAWTEAWFNRTGVSIESGDPIWLLQDPHGFAQLARMTAYLLRDNNLPPIWIPSSGLISWGKGFSRHADGGALAGGHTACPTTDLDLWRQFVGRVKDEHAHGHFRPRGAWGRR